MKNKFNWFNIMSNDNLKKKFKRQKLRKGNFPDPDSNDFGNNSAQAENSESEKKGKRSGKHKKKSSNEDLQSFAESSLNDSDENSDDMSKLGNKTSNKKGSLSS